MVWRKGKRKRRKRKSKWVGDWDRDGKRIEKGKRNTIRNQEYNKRKRNWRIRFIFNRRRWRFY